jgi:hypothetical protein
LGRKQISALPLRLAGSQALAQYKKSVLAHWRYGHEILATRKWKEDELLMLVWMAKYKCLDCIDIQRLFWLVCSLWFPL